MSVLELRGLTKHYGAAAAVDDLSLTVEAGEIYGFLGRNGAGKTTTIRMLLGMIKPDAGSVSLFGQPVRSNRGPWGRVGALVESAVAWPDLSVRDNLRTLADYHGLDYRGVDTVLETLGLGPVVDRPARALSLGNGQRLGLAMALLPRPELLILDEPVNGLDPAGVVEIREALIAMARDHGTTIFLSSHLLDEVARTCTRVGFLHNGRLVQELTLGEWESMARHRLVVETPDPQGARRALEASGVPLTRISLEAEDLEGLFLRLTGGTE